MALLNIGDDPWVLEYQSCEKLHRDIMEQLSMRQKENKQSENHARLSASIRQRLKQFSNEVNDLKNNLEVPTSKKTLTNEEFERRLRQIELLQSKYVQMQKLFDDPITTASRDRERLIGGRGFNDVPTANWGDDDDEMLVAASSSNDDLKGKQHRMLEDQEQSLDALSKVISRQKNIAQTISSEVDLHNDILDDLGDHVERTDMRVRNETSSIQVIDSKDNTCWYWIIIIALFVAIIVVWII